MSFKDRRFSVVLIALFACLIPVVGPAAPSKCGGIPVLRGGASRTSSWDSRIKLVSLNAARETDVRRILADVRGRESLSDTDVWLLQEAVNPAGSESRMIEDLASEMGLYFAYAAADIDEAGTASGLAILSRYPMTDVQETPLPRYDLRFRSRCRIALAATIRASSGPLRLFNVHLDTRINSSDRLGQIRPVLQSAASVSGPVIVGGDFNTNNLHWFWNVLPLPFIQDQTGVIRRAFASDGFVSPMDKGGATFRVLGLPLSLDWIFHKGMKTMQSGVESIGFSDHHAVWVSLSE
jgi:endonuclease/exonuclease/phosphatase family metal-dependent hydrolase